jgi:hypothetical protein
MCLSACISYPSFLSHIFVILHRFFCPGRSIAETLVVDTSLSVTVIESRTFYEEEYLITYAFGPGGDDHYKAITHDRRAVEVPGVQYVYAQVVSVNMSGLGFRVTLADGTDLQSTVVVCATGVLAGLFLLQIPPLAGPFLLTIPYVTVLFLLTIPC